MFNFFGKRQPDENSNDNPEVKYTSKIQEDNLSADANDALTARKTDNMPEKQSEEEKNQDNEPDIEEDLDSQNQTEKKQGFFGKLFAGLAKTRDAVISGIDSIFKDYEVIDEDFYDDLEEQLIMGDIGVHATADILDDLKEKVKNEHIKDPSLCRELLIDSIRQRMDLGENAFEFENRKSVLLIIGVNGVGKTTSVGKLASQFKNNGRKVLVAAADTFRAAAIEQLKEWTGRAGVDLISGKEGSDPASIVFDACQAAKARNADILIIDTAGRLHNKKNLMEELKKVSKVIDNEYPDAYRETLVVLDGTTGQNALEQAREFKNVTDITGIILTKLDGTSKGGIAVAIQAELSIPVKYIGVGEKAADMQKFDPDQYVNALFKTDDTVEESNNA